MTAVPGWAMKCWPRCAVRTPERHNRFDDWMTPPATMTARRARDAEALPALGTVAAEVAAHGHARARRALDALDARAARRRQPPSATARRSEVTAVDCLASCGQPCRQRPEPRQPLS